jgi:hypothetical protein
MTITTSNSVNVKPERRRVRNKVGLNMALIKLFILVWFFDVFPRPRAEGGCLEIAFGAKAAGRQEAGPVAGKKMGND